MRWIDAHLRFISAFLGMSALALWACAGQKSQFQGKGPEGPAATPPPSLPGPGEWKIGKPGDQETLRAIAPVHVAGMNLRAEVDCPIVDKVEDGTTRMECSFRQAATQTILNDVQVKHFEARTKAGASEVVTTFAPEASISGEHSVVALKLPLAKLETYSSLHPILVGLEEPEFASTIQVVPITDAVVETAKREDKSYVQAFDMTAGTNCVFPRVAGETIGQEWYCVFPDEDSNLLWKSSTPGDCGGAAKIVTTTLGGLCLEVNTARFSLETTTCLENMSSKRLVAKTPAGACVQIFRTRHAR